MSTEKSLDKLSFYKKDLIEKLNQDRNFAQAFGYACVYGMQDPIEFSIIKAEKIELKPMLCSNGPSEAVLPVFDRDISNET